MPTFPATTRTRAIAALLGTVAFVLFVIALLQHLSGWPFTVTVPLEIERDSKREGEGVHVRVPRDFRSPLTDARGMLLRDGLPVGERVPSNKAVKEFGGGRFRIADHILWMSSPDGIDPADPAHPYALRAPVLLGPRMPALLFVAAFGLLAFAGRDPTCRRWADRAMGRIRVPGTTVLATLAAVAALATGAWSLDQETFNNTFSDNGMPYSDAMGWNELAVRLACGRGMSGPFEAQRPFYPASLAALYLVTGPSVSVAKAFNDVTWALLAFFSVALAAQGASRLTAVGVGGFVLLSQWHREMVHLLLTEELGTMLSVVSLFLFWWAVATGDRTNARWWRQPALLLAAGALFGFSNLARPLTLLAAPVLAAVILEVELTRGRGWVRRTAINVAALAVGTILVIGPWVARQKVVHGIWSISSTSADLLYAGATDEGWSGDTIALFDGRDSDTPIRTQVEFYNNLFKERVKADPVGYAVRIGRNVVDFFQGLDVRAVDARMFGVLFALAAAVVASIRAGSLVGLATFAVLWPGVLAALHLPPIVLVGVSAAIPFFGGSRGERILVASIAATLLGNALLSAMIGNFGLPRMSGLRDLLATILFCIAVTHLVNRLAQLAARAAGIRHRPGQLFADADVANRVPARVGLVVLATCIAIATTVAARNVVPSPTSLTVASFPAPLREESERWCREHLPEVVGRGDLLHPLLFLDVVSMWEYHSTIPANVNTGHWARTFAPRPYDRTVCFVRLGGDWQRSRGLIAVEIPRILETLPRDPVVLAAVRNTDPDAPLGHDITILEALAVIPINEEDRSLSPEAAIRFEPSPEAITLLESGGEAPTPQTPSTPVPGDAAIPASLNAPSTGRDAAAPAATAVGHDPSD